MRLLTLAAILTTLSAFAGDELSPEKRAELQRAQKKAGEAVEKKYGNKKPSELSPDERKAMAREKGDAENAVLEKAGVDGKEFARSGAKMSRDDKATLDNASKGLDAKEAEELKQAEAKAKKGGGKKEIVIERDGKPADGAEINEAAELDKAMGRGKGKK